MARVVVAVVVAVVISAGAALRVSGSAGGRPADAVVGGHPAPVAGAPSTFAWFRPGRAPRTWPDLRLAHGAGRLLVPPGFERVPGDKGTVSAARFSTSGSYQAYLNATPLQGDEDAGNWASFRIDHLLGDDAQSAHRVASERALRFRTGIGSCVIDQYVTKAGSHPYREVACLVMGHWTGSVVVAAAPPAEWHVFGSALERAVSDYTVS